MQNLKTITSYHDLEINIIRKKVKHLRMTISPPYGEIKISAPLAVSNYTIREFVFTQLNWIKKHQNKYKNQIIQPQLNFLSGEYHYYLGKQYQLKVIDIVSTRDKKITIDDNYISLYVKPDLLSDKRERFLYEWYRSEIKKIIPGLIKRWEPVIGKKVLEWRIRRMKSRWGSCNIKEKRIWLNLELIKKPPECIEYVLVHEMVHLLERYHNKNFYCYMDQFLPQWKTYRKLLNQN